MKILHVIPILGCGGAEVLLGHIALAQKKSGCEVAIVSLRNFHETFDHYPNKELFLREIPLSFTKSRANILPWRTDLKDWNSLLSKFKPDVIHAHLYEADFLAHSVVLPKVAYITHIHGPVPELVKRKSFPTKKIQLTELLERRWLHHRYKKSQTHFIAISNSMFEYARRIVPSSLFGQVHMLANATDLGYYTYRNRKAISNPVQLISVGNLLKRKNYEFLIKVVAKLRDEGISSHLNILGYGGEEQTLRSLIHSLHLEGAIDLRGSVGNVNSYLSDADLYLHAAQPEPFGLALIEAMASGLPVISLEGGATKDVVIDGVTGFIIKENKEELFAEKIKLLINNQTLYKSMSFEAGVAVKKFDIENYIKKIEGIYEQALESRL